MSFWEVLSAFHPYIIYIGYLYHYTYHFIHHAKLLSGPEILILKSINQKSCWLLELVALSSFRFGYIVMSQRYWTFNIKTKTFFERFADQISKIGLICWSVSWHKNWFNLFDQFVQYLVPLYLRYASVGHQSTV